MYCNYCLRTGYREHKIYLNSTPSPSSPHHLRRTWTSVGYLGMVQWIVGIDTLRKHLRCPSTAGGRLVTTGILSWSETILEGVLEARKKCSGKWFIEEVPLTAGCWAKSHLHRSLLKHMKANRVFGIKDENFTGACFTTVTKNTLLQSITTD